MSYAQTVTEHLRGMILTALEESPQYRGNTRVLHNFAADRGVVRPWAELEAAVEWLAEAGLVERQTIGAAFVVATLTQAGLEVAEQIVLVQGVTVSPRFPR